jgi:hypothetical protein
MHATSYNFAGQTSKEIPECHRALCEERQRDDQPLPRFLLPHVADGGRETPLQPNHEETQWRGQEIVNVHEWVLFDPFEVPATGEKMVK